MIKKLLFLWVCCFSLCACGIYSTTQYNNTVDITQTDFSKIQDFKKASSCSYLVLGFIPWPWAEKTPDTLFEAIEQSGIKKVVFMDKTFDYHFTYARSCINAYGY